MKYKKIIIFAIVVLGAGLSYFYFYEKYPEIKEYTLKFIEDKKREFSEPGPLKFESKSSKSFLTVSGTLEWTNIHRNQNGFDSLASNEKLNLAARDKMNDMFARQYFAHYGPNQSSGASETAEKHGYDYIAIGENLALGNFEDDKELVQAWMDSPGHRANILNSKFEEIGIAVGRGRYEGQTTWIAVQIFAKPASSCPQLDQSLKNQIADNQSLMDTMRADIDRRKAELESYEPKRGPEYNRKVDEYNSAVKSYNDLIKETKNLVDDYNSSVRDYNSCIQE